MKLHSSRMHLSGVRDCSGASGSLNACGFFEFWRAEELIAMGRERAEQAFKQPQQ